VFVQLAWKSVEGWIEYALCLAIFRWISKG
jgi:hypothetical protein